METFVIRVWTPAEHESGCDLTTLRGLVEHVGSGDRRVFRGVGELLAVVHEHLALSGHREELDLPDAARAQEGVPS